MAALHIDDFYDVSAEVFCTLYAAFPVRHLLLVEDLKGPIKWDLTGLPDRRSRACFETLIWLADHRLLTFRTVEPREIGIEGAVLTQQAFGLLSGAVDFEDGERVSRIEALKDARARRAYDDIGAVIQDLLRANCHWRTPFESLPLDRAQTMEVSDEVSGSA